MARFLASLIVMVLALFTGWLVFTKTKDLMDYPVPYILTGLTVIIVFCIIYFPLLRPIFDAIGYRLHSSLRPIKKHSKEGTGLENIPRTSLIERRSAINCTICNGPGGPVCEKCLLDMKS